MSVHRDYLWCDAPGCGDWATPAKAEEDGWTRMDDATPVKALEVVQGDQHRCGRHPTSQA